MSAAGREPAGEHSRGSRAFQGGWALLRALVLTGFVGGALLVLADFLTLIEIKVLTVSKASISGGSHHSYALVVLGAFALIMALGTLLGRSRPAMVALAVIGLIALAIALVIDLPEVHDTGAFGQRFEDARASPQVGFYAETLGAVLLLLAGGALLLVSPRRRRRARPARAPAEEGVGPEAPPVESWSEPDGATAGESGGEPADAPVAAEVSDEHDAREAGITAGAHDALVRGRPRAIAARAAAERLARRAREARRKG